MPHERHVPLRRCVACRTSLPKERLIRFVKGEDGAWRLDAQGRAGGRGTWICDACAREADPKRIAKGFRGRPDAVIEQLRVHLRDATPRDARGRTGSEPPNTIAQHDRTVAQHDPRPLNSGGNHG